ncbi:MAG: biotin/lipoyl-binding protein [Chloroflexi bacterium]|nr:biotin/lipoyl-binding protein [Chloroflexota bacterium]
MMTKRSGWFLAIVLALAVLMAGCGAGPNTEDPDEDVESAPVQTGPSVVSVTGVVVPSEEATLSFTVSGEVAELVVEAGDEVEAGDVIARLDTTLLDLDVAQAEAAVVVAEANLARALAGPSEQEITEQEANIAASSASTGAEAAERDDLFPSDIEIERAEIALQQAFITRLDARIFRDYVEGVEENPDDYSRYERFALPGLIDEAQEDFAIADAEWEIAYERLQDLLDGPDPNELAAANADVGAAAADLAASQARLDELLTLPLPEDIAVSEAAVESARVSLIRAELARDQAVLVSPFSGTISDVFIQASQYVNVGEPIILMADIANLRIETTDLNEIDVARIDVGSEAIITFDALPSVEVEGEVISIAPRVDEGVGVNFKVIIEVGEAMPEGVRWGMTAFVDIVVED